MVSSIEFLGYHVDGEGRHPTHEKITAISEAQSPKNVRNRTSLLLRAAELLWTLHS